MTTKEKAMSDIQKINEQQHQLEQRKLMKEALLQMDSDEEN